ncbi:MAG: DUF2061 domain-containing protein [Planctomycetota bacterium]
MDSAKRTLVKTFSWRLAATVVTSLVALSVTGRLELAASIAVLDTLLKLAAYYCHERAWERIPFGRKTKIKLVAITEEAGNDN